MAGIQIKLKGKGITKNSSNNGSSRINLAGAKSKLLAKEKTFKKPNALQDSDEDDGEEEKTVFISSFDKNEFTSDRSVDSRNPQKKLTIIPENLQANISRQILYKPNQEQKQVIKKTTEKKLEYGLNKIAPVKRDIEKAKIIEPKLFHSLEEKARISLLSAESAVERSEMSIPIDNELDNDLNGRPEESTADEYKSVPVEEFGAALLRGMGWKSENKKNQVKKVEVNNKKGLFLGIGAKAAEDEIMEELVAKKGVKFQVPLVKKGNE